jgi:hypothetical protein
LVGRDFYRVRALSIIDAKAKIGFLFNQISEVIPSWRVSQLIDDGFSFKTVN